MPASRSAGPGPGAGVGAGGANLRTENSAFRPPGRLQEPRDFAHFSGGKRVLGSFFQFSGPSINKPPELAAFGPAGGGRREGLGRGAALLHFNENANPFRQPHSLSGGASSSKGTRPPALWEAPPAGRPKSSPGEPPEPPRAPATRRSTKAAAGPRTPGSSPARPGIGFLHKSAAG